jgi:FixJ family two-component response regulator
MVRPLVCAVDDDAQVLESLENLLQSAGYDVRVFDSGAAFLGCDAVRLASCLISDVLMPGMDGWRLEKELATLRPDLPIIFISGNDAISETLVLRKPFDPAHLLREVGRRLRGG